MLDLRELQLQLEEGIYSGTVTIENFHRQITGIPLNELSRIDSIAGPVSTFRQFHDNYLATAYELVRSVNRDAGRISRDILNNLNL